MERQIKQIKTFSLKETKEPEISEVFNFDLGAVRDTAYIFARRYTEPAYHIKRKFWNPEHKKADLINYAHDVRKDKRFNDCFGSTWIVLEDLARAGYIRSIYLKSITDTVPIILNSIREGCLVEFDSVDTLRNKTAGIFFVLRRGEVGFVTSGLRHIGFWFLFGNDVRIIHNTRDQGVIEVVMSFDEFETYLKSFYKAFV